MARARSVLKLAAVNLAVFAALYLALAAAVAVFFPDRAGTGAAAGHDGNTIRATYPTHAGFDPDIARAIFEEAAAPQTRYVPFVGYRREGFAGRTLNIDPETGFRLSTGHAVDGAIWFLGGSTMWGTGVTDAATIPSLVAQAGGWPVLNLGESGYGAFQELVQLQVLLAQGHRPRLAVFYDGFNDGYYACQPGEPLPTHPFRARFAELIESGSRQSTGTLAAQALAERLQRAAPRLWDFLAAPLRLVMPGRASVSDPVRISADTPFAAFEANARYLVCDDPATARRAAGVMVQSWLAAHAVLQDQGVEALFVLQPAAAIAPERHELDYIIDGHKQLIANEVASFRVFYDTVRGLWRERCGAAQACDAFVDLSGSLADAGVPMFIDDVHLGPRGNEAITRALIPHLEERLAAAGGGGR